jgi:hypothetical protein
MNFTYYNCIIYGGSLAITAAVLFWSLLAASIITALRRKYESTHCLLAAAWAITFAICWVFTRRMMGAILGTIPCGCFGNRDPIMIFAFNFESSHIVPLWHFVGSIVVIMLWIIIRPREFLKPITVSLLVVLLLASIFNYGVKDTVCAWREMNIKGHEEAAISRESKPPPSELTTSPQTN